MYHVDDPEKMTPEERFREVAAILAKGFLRMKRDPACFTGEPSEETDQAHSDAQDLSEPMREISSPSTEK